MKFTITDTWQPPENKPWSFDKDGKTITLITYYLTVDEQDGPGGVKCRIHMKPESPVPEKGQVLEGKLIQKTSKAGKEYLQFKKDGLPPLQCPECQFAGSLDEFKQKREEKPQPAKEAPSLAPVDTTDYGKDSIPF